MTSLWPDTQKGRGWDSSFKELTYTAVEATNSKTWRMRRRI